MLNLVKLFAVLTVIIVISNRSSADDFDTQKYVNWHQWRGPDANGVAKHADPPLTWSEQENIQWKVPIDGRGISTPIVWGEKVFLLSAINTNNVDPRLPKLEDQPKRPFGIKYPNTTYQFIVLCFDRNNGQELWRRTAVEMIPHEGFHSDNSFASASPTTDGQRLYAWFGAPGGLFCYDLDGKLLWKRDFGHVNMRKSFGEAASPVLYGDRLIVTRDNEGESYIQVVNALTGDDVWKAKRDEPSAWSTPLVVNHNNQTQVITNASNRVRSYDLKDGSIIWQCGGQVGNVTPSPVADNGLVFCMSGYRGSAVFALPLNASGDITGTDKIAWSENLGAPYVPSPLLYDGLLFFNQSNNAILSAYEAKTGKQVINRTRMPKLQRIYASPVGAAGHIYFIGRSGEALVIERGTEIKILAKNRLDESFDASPAIVGDQMYLRGRKYLYCISSQ